MSPDDAIAQTVSRLLRAHRSIRRFEPRAVEPALLDAALDDAFCGSSSSGNLNMVSVIRTREPERKRRLYELHFEQPMVLEAPLVLTFCADTLRTRRWLALRGARPGFADFVSWHVAAFDAVIVAQSTALALESRGLGICYMGTTLHAMGALAEFLGCPETCLPVTSMVVGWPAETPAARDRLPARAWLHDERYREATPQTIERDFAERERRGRERYLALGPEVAERWREHGIESLAQFYTSKIKYDPDRFAEDSKALRALLQARGFLS